MENSMLEGDVDALYVKTEQIQQALVAKDQKLKDLGNIHWDTFLTCFDLNLASYKVFKVGIKGVDTRLGQYDDMI